jgi:hypothetical protein
MKLLRGWRLVQRQPVPLIALASGQLAGWLWSQSSEVYVFSDWQRKVKGRAGIDPPLGPGAAAMARDYATNIRQANAGSLEDFAGMEAPKDAKEFVCVSIFEADPVVPDENHHLVVAFLSLANLDFGQLARARVLNGVREEIDQDLAKHGTIGLDLWEACDRPADLAILSLVAQFADRFLDQGLQGYPLSFHCRVAHAGESEQIIDKPAHMAG